MGPYTFCSLEPKVTQCYFIRRVYRSPLGAVITSPRGLNHNCDLVLLFAVVELLKEAGDLLLGAP
jgi:hypothetical protein